MTIRLRTQRLDLEPLGAPDLTAFHALSTEQGIRRYLWDDEVITLDRAREALEASDRSWADSMRFSTGSLRTPFPAE